MTMAVKIHIMEEVIAETVLYSGTGTYNDGGNGTYGTYDQPYNNGGNGTYNRSHNNRGNGTYNGTYNRRTGQNQQDDNLIWDDGLPEVPDNRGNKGDQKKWLISIGCTVGILVITVVVLALLLGKKFRRKRLRIL